MQLSATPEAFLTLRSHFVQTLACVSMCQYVLGIGDRHLSNFMVDMESGGVVGIDFGHNFGTATQVGASSSVGPTGISSQLCLTLSAHKKRLKKAEIVYYSIYRLV